MSAGNTWVCRKRPSTYTEGVFATHQPSVETIHQRGLLANHLRLALHLQRTHPRAHFRLDIRNVHIDFRHSYRASNQHNIQKEIPRMDLHVMLRVHYINCTLNNKHGRNPLCVRNSEQSVRKSAFFPRALPHSQWLKWLVFTLSRFQEPWSLEGPHFITSLIFNWGSFHIHCHKT